MAIQINDAGPSDAQIEDLVSTFYARIRKDAELGPIFERVIGADWTPHLKTMCDFWSSVMNTTGRYKGRPIPAHVKLTGIEPRHFEHWLALFRETTQALFEPALAEAFQLRAERIAASLMLGFAFHAEKPEIWGGIPRAGNG
jgi:hemoglobin